MAHSLAIPFPPHAVTQHIAAVPTPLRVLIENPPSPLPSPFHVVTESAAWTVSDILTLAIAIGTLALAVAAVGTIIANDLATQEQNLPHLDLEEVTEFRILEDGQEVTLGRLTKRNPDGREELGLGFTLRNDGTGPAREVRLHLEAYDSENVRESVYLGGIGPNQTRRYSQKSNNEQRFKLPPRAANWVITASNVREKKCVLLLTYFSMRGAIGDAYIEMNFPSGTEPKRQRTTPPVPTRRGVMFLLWVICGLPWVRPTRSDSDLKADRRKLKQSLRQ